MIEKEYFPTPYHNSTHGADVLHAICYLALDNPYLRDKITNNELFACIIAALGHDIDHPVPSLNYHLIKRESIMPTW